MTIRGTASSSDYISCVEVKIDTDDWITLEGTYNWVFYWDTTLVTDGTHIITFQASDEVGCYNMVSLEVDVQNSKNEGEDITPPIFGEIIQDPAQDPVEADQSVEICVEVTDPSGISSVNLTSNLGDDLVMTDPDFNDIYCGELPAHNGETVIYSTTARDNSPNYNQATINAGYSQSSPAIDTDPPSISSVNFSILWIEQSQATIAITALITDASIIDEVSFTYSGSGGEGGGEMSPMDQSTYFGTYQRQKNKSCTLTITAIDEFGNTATYVISDEGAQ